MRPMRILAGALAAFMGLCGLAASAQVSDGSGTAPPIFAQTQPSDPWAGLYVGSGLSFASGPRGGLGGGAYAGFDRELPNNWVINFQGGVGYAPGFVAPYSLANGFNYAQASVKAGYDYGRFMPFLTAGVAFAKPNLPFTVYTGPMQAANDLFSSSGNLQTLTSVGAGFDYAINRNMSIEMSVSATQGQSAVWPVGPGFAGDNFFFAR